MNRHSRFQVMLASDGARTAAENNALFRHLQVCKRCQGAEAEYNRQRAVMGHLMRNPAPEQIREQVAARLETVRGAAPRRSNRASKIAVRLACVGVLLGAVGINTPLQRVVAQAVGIGAALTSPDAHQQCNSDGIALLTYDKLLASPNDFDPGPHGWRNQAALNRANSTLAHITWFVIGDTASIGTRSCGGRDGLGGPIAGNPDNHTVLMSYGLYIGAPRGQTVGEGRP
jgi:hypothetical protein